MMFRRVCCGCSGLTVVFAFGIMNHQARLTLVKMLADFAIASRKAAEGRKAAGKEAGCLLDVWMEVEKETNEQLPDDDIGHHLLDFLFASQVSFSARCSSHNLL